MKKLAKRKIFLTRKKFRDKVEAIFGESSELLDPGALQDVMAITMAAEADADPCIKARKCLLVPYKDADKTSKGNGCCPGQTGHHVLPGAMFRSYEPEPNIDNTAYKKNMKNTGKRNCWEDYNHNDALTICLEGTTNNAANGSHGDAHKRTGNILDKYRESTDMPYTDARNKISKLFSEIYGCEVECLKIQLDSSFQKMHSCGDLETATVSPHSGETNGGPTPPDFPITLPNF